jgi:hypothetical protein
MQSQKPTSLGPSAREVEHPRLARPAQKCALVPRCIWCESSSGDANVQPLCLPANAAFAATYTCQPAVEAVKQELKDELTKDVEQLAPLFDPCMDYKVPLANTPFSLGSRRLVTSQSSALGVYVYHPNPHVGRPAPLELVQSLTDDKVLCTQDEGACHTNATCTWCTAGAIPSECLSRDLAKMLPTAIFSCDLQEVDTPFRPEAKECFAHQADEAACGSNPACNFCKSKVSKEHLPDTCLPSVRAHNNPHNPTTLRGRITSRPQRTIRAAELLQRLSRVELSCH